MLRFLGADLDGVSTLRLFCAGLCAGDAAIVLPVRGEDRIGAEQGDDMRFVEVEIIHRQHTALLCLAQEIGQCLHAEAVVIGDKPFRLPQRELGKDVGNLRVRKQSSSSLSSF